MLLQILYHDLPDFISDMFATVLIKATFNWALNLKVRATAAL